MDIKIKKENLWETNKGKVSRKEKILENWRNEIGREA